MASKQQSQTRGHVKDCAGRAIRLFRAAAPIDRLRTISFMNKNNGSGYGCRSAECVSWTR